MFFQTFNHNLSLLGFLMLCFSNADDKVTVLESEKRAWENSPEALAVREALNPWRHIDSKENKDH